MSIAQRSVQRTESSPKDRILDSAQQLFSRRGYAGTTTRDLAQSAGMAEGTLFRHFENKKAILVAVVTRGWVELLTDLLTALSEMSSYKAVDQVLRGRMLHFHDNADMLRVCFMEAQFHPELSHRIQTESIDKMTDVAEAFFQTAMERGEYRPGGAGDPGDEAWDAQAEHDRAHPTLVAPGGAAGDGRSPAY